MADQNCPVCKENSFTWYVDEEETPLTQWLCRHCSYKAYEDESTLRECSNCKNKTENLLQDETKSYYWCSNCDRVTIVG